MAPAARLVEFGATGSKGGKERRGKEFFVLCKLNICVTLQGKEIAAYGF